MLRMFSLCKHSTLPTMHYLLYRGDNKLFPILSTLCLGQFFEMLTSHNLIVVRNKAI